MKSLPRLPKRGEVYWASLDPALGSEIQKTRPVVVVSANPINQARRTVIAVPLSTSAPPIEGINIGLSGGSVARCDQIRTLDKQRLRQLIGEISRSDLEKITKGLVRVMDLDTVP